MSDERSPDRQLYVDLGRAIRDLYESGQDAARYYSDAALADDRTEFMRQLIGGTGVARADSGWR